MAIVRLVSLLSLFFLTPVAFAADDKVIVFDLDNVVLFHPGPQTPPSKIIHADTDPTAKGDLAARSNDYRVADGFPELLQSLVASGWKVHVYSFGNAVRNNSVLKRIKLPDGTTAHDAVTRSGGKIFDSTWGADPKTGERKTFDPSEPRETKAVKSLELVLGKEEAKKAFIVDDIPGNIKASERTENVVFLPFQWQVLANGEQKNEFRENNEEVERALREKGDYEALALARERFRRQNDKIPYLAGLLAKAEERAAKSGRPVREELMDLQYQRGQDGKVVTDAKTGAGVLKDGLVDDVALVAKGRQVLRAGADIAKLVDSLKTPSTIAGSTGPSCLDTISSVVAPI